MKITSFIATALMALLMPVTTFAASIALNPTSVTPTVEKTFTVIITADPAGAKTYTFRANVSFDPKLVQLVSFSFAPKWVVLSQTGYDTEDNETGSLIKTAGYPGGLTTSSTVFGTATFRATAPGTSSIRVTTDSLALIGTGANQISGTQGTTLVTVAALQAPAAPVQETKKTIVTENKTEKIATTAKTVTTAVTTELSAVATTAPAVAAAAAAGFSFSSIWLWLPFVLIIIGAWYYYRRVKGGK